MPGPRFCRLVSLLPAYGGAVAQALAHAVSSDPGSDLQLLPVPTQPAPIDRPTPITPAVAALGPHADLFSFATAGGPGV